MKLSIKRALQRKARLLGLGSDTTSYTMLCRLECSEAEREIIGYHHLDDLLLATLRRDSEKATEITVRELTEGVEIETQDAWQAFANEDEIRFASEEFAKFLRDVKAFEKLYVLDLEAKQESVVT